MQPRIALKISSYVLFLALLHTGWVHQSHAQTRSSEPLNLPSAQELLKLSYSEQMEYISEVRKIVAQMNDQSKFFAHFFNFLENPRSLTQQNHDKNFLKFLDLASAKLVPTAVADNDSVNLKILAARLAFNQLQSESKSLPEDPDSKQTAGKGIRDGLLSKVFAPLERESGIIRDRIKARKGSAQDIAADKKALASILATYKELKAKAYDDTQPVHAVLTPQSRGSINFMEKTMTARVTNIDAPARAGSDVSTRDSNAGKPSRVARRTSDISGSRNRALSPTTVELAQTATAAAKSNLVGTTASGATGPLPAARGASLAVAASGDAKVTEIQAREAMKTKGCMYAGFILIADTCDRPQSLPIQFKDQKTLNTDTFKCSPGEVICNPLLFGYDIVVPGDDKINCDRLDNNPSCKDFNYAKPICIRAAKTATRDCLAKSKPTEKYSERALALIKANPELFNQYISDFQKICDKTFMKENSFIYYDQDGRKRNNAEYYSDDISSTCEKAEPKFRELYKTHFKKDFEWSKTLEKVETPSRLDPRGRGAGGPPGQGPADRPQGAAPPGDVVRPGKPGLPGVGSR